MLFKEAIELKVDLALKTREIETVSYLASGYGAKEIARALNISPRTVEHRIEALKRRFGARNVTHLVAIVLLSDPAQNLTPLIKTGAMLRSPSTESSLYEEKFIHQIGLD